MTRKEFRVETAKLKNMTPADRRWYIWNYYKVPILIGLVILFMLYEVGGAFWRSRQDCMLYCIFINQASEEEAQLNHLKDDFYEHENFSGLQIVTFDASIRFTDDLYSDASAIVFQSLISTDTVDIVITKQSVMEQFHNQNIFLNLQEVLPPQHLSQLESALYYDADSSGTPVPIGIYLKNSILPSEYGLEEDSILGVCTLNNHPEVIQDFISFILK